MGLHQELLGLVVDLAGLLEDGLVYARRTLLEHELADELRLTVYPVVAGGGRRLFGEASGNTSLRLLATQAVGDSLVSLTYERVRNAG